MQTTHDVPSQPISAALRIGGAAALAFVALLSISAAVDVPAVMSPVGAGVSDHGITISQSAVAPASTLPSDTTR